MGISMITITGPSCAMARMNATTVRIVANGTSTAASPSPTEWVQNGAPDRVLTFFRRVAGEEYFVVINVSNQPYAGVVDAPAGEYADQTPGLDEAASKNATPPVLVLNAWDFRIYRKVH